MDLDSHLANLSLGEIASLLSPKQQEVLLASISVAASIIQQIQQEDTQQTTPTQSPSPSDQSPSPSLIQQTQSQQLQLQQQHHHLISNQLQTQIHTPRAHTPPQHHHHQQQQQQHYASPQSHQQQQQSQQQLPEHYVPTTKRELEIRQFAEELKQRRKAIRLSQKGAAQSLRAFTSGAEPCTDAIIYHFENLQLEPERAMHLIPLLSDWLEWAEKHRLNGKQLPMMTAITKVPRERKRKVVLFNEKAKHYLEDAFMKNNHPDRYQLDVISQDLNIPTRSIRKWFTNRRQRKRFAEKFSHTF